MNLYKINIKYRDRVWNKKSNVFHISCRSKEEAEKYFRDNLAHGIEITSLKVTKVGEAMSMVMWRSKARNI